MMRLWEFQNGKMGVYRQKINQDTVKNVKILILKNISFCKELMFFFMKTAIFQNLIFYLFNCILVNFLPIYAHFTILEFSKSLH